MTGTTFGEYLTWGADVLRSAKVDEPRREARLLLSHASGRPVEWITAHSEAHLLLVGLLSSFEKGSPKRIYV